MANTTPFVKRMRTQGGTIYTFSSATEDIGLNINERNNIVKMSHYALLDIPSIDAPINLQQNRFNAFAIPGAFNSFLTGGSVKDGRVVIAESFQNYALNLETNLLDSSSYNPSLTATVAERVFWKWLKETGAIRWNPIDTSAGTYWEEETDTDTSVGYSSIVKCIGQISAGAVRTDTFGTYNETYILVPTSFGQSRVFFKQTEDDNYHHGLSIVNGNINILGRENYTKPHPDGLDIKAYYDIDASNKMVPTYNMQYDYSVGSWNSGWWTTAESIPFTHYSYYTDISTYLVSGKYNMDLQYVGSSTISFKRSVVDCLSIEYDLNNLKTIYNDSALTYDQLSIDHSVDDTFNFNAVLLYYSVYNKTADTLLATNLLGILFLDPPSGNTSGYPITEITMPSITKLQSGPSGFGTSYSFRLNIKSDYMIDDTLSIVTDTTASQVVLEDFSQVFDSLSKSVNILNQQSATINYIYQQYLDMSAQFTDVVNNVNDIQFQVNDVTQDITGTENAIAMFTAGNDPIGDSSIYMKNGNVGIFTNQPRWGVEIDSSVKVKDLIIENAIRDTSGNILLGYGSPLQIGSPNSVREIKFYTGTAIPAFSIDSSNVVSIGNQSGPYLQESSIGIYFYWSAGKLEPSAGTGNVTNTYVDGSLAKRDASIQNIYNSGVKQGLYVKEASLGTGLSWSAGLLYVDVSVAAGGVTAAYVDGSLAKRDTSTYNLSISLLSYSTNSSVGTALGAYATNVSIGTAAFAKNASFNSYSTNSSVNTAFGSYATNSSVNLAVSGFAPASSPTLTGTPLAPTASNVYENTLQIATTQFVQSRVQLTDASVLFLDGKRLNHDTSLNSVWTKLGNVDTSLSNLGVRNANHDTSLNSVWTKLGSVDTSLSNLGVRNANHDTSLNSVWTKLGSVDTSLSNLGVRNANQDVSLNSVWTKLGSVDTSLSNLGVRNANQDSSLLLLDNIKANKAAPTFTTSFGIGNWTFVLSGADLLLKLDASILFKFTSDGSLLTAGEITAKVTL